ncbi:MAG: hypothetical protein ACOXZ2_08630 [Sphaerochaetaceae bacterium]|nr:hypothetical protein [Sphaerochaetaceae bacterium]HHU88036.1 hypothetical protein [Spirochaetales bacterium]
MEKSNKSGEQSHWEEVSSSRFERLVYRAFSESLISNSKATALLNLPLKDERRLVL